MELKFVVIASLIIWLVAFATGTEAIDRLPFMLFWVLGMYLVRKERERKL